MSTHATSIKKQMRAIRYALGFLTLGAIIVVILFIRAQTLTSPPLESRAQNTTQQDTSWQCPGNAWVQCDDILESSGVSCEKEYIMWALESCSGFQGVVN